MVLLRIVLRMIRVPLDSPRTEMPPPPIPPLHPACTLLVITFPWISGPPKPMPMPTPLQALFERIVLFVIVGDELLTAMPPPSP